MDANDLERLTARIATLESFNRRLSRAIVALLVVAASAVFMAQAAKTPQRKKPAAAPAPPKVVEAEQFVLKNAGGKVLATLGMTDGPTLRLVGPNGTDRAVLALDQAGTPRLTMMTSEGSQPLSMSLGADGLPQVEVTAPNKSKARLTIGAEGGPSVAFLDSAGTPRLGLDLKTSGPAIALGGKDGTALATLSVVEKTDTVQAGPSLTLSEPEGHPRIALKVVSQQAGISILDASGRAMVGLEVKAESPALGLYGANGKALFVKP